jgi:hypothetical protein
MAPEERASLADLARLRREIAEDRSAMARRSAQLGEARRAWAGTATAGPLLAYAAVALHAWYTTLETGLERIARVIDEEVPRSDSSHRDLLSQAMTEIPGVRPAVLSTSTQQDLLGLLTFRDFFRHAYAVDLDAAKLYSEMERLARVEPIVSSGLGRFDAVLDAAEQALVSRA